MDIKKVGAVYSSIHYWLLQRSNHFHELSRKEVLGILGELFHVPKEYRSEVFIELIKLGILTKKSSLKILEELKSQEELDDEVIGIFCPRSLFIVSD